MSKKNVNEEPKVLGVDVAPAEDVTVKEPVKTPTKKNVTGVVTECTRLRVRNTPAVQDGNVISELNLADEVVVDLKESTDEFYKISTKTGVKGFCMKKFINIGE